MNESQLCFEPGNPCRIFIKHFTFIDFLQYFKAENSLQFEFLTVAKPGTIIIDLVNLDDIEDEVDLSSKDSLLTFIQTKKLTVYEFFARINQTIEVRCVIDSVEFSFSSSQIYEVYKLLDISNSLGEIILRNKNRMIYLESGLINIGPAVDSLELLYTSIIEDTEMEMAESYNLNPQNWCEVNFGISPLSIIP